MDEKLHNNSTSSNESMEQGNSAEMVVPSPKSNLEFPKANTSDSMQNSKDRNQRSRSHHKHGKTRHNKSESQHRKRRKSGSRETHRRSRSHSASRRSHRDFTKDGRSRRSSLDGHRSRDLSHEEHKRRHSHSRRSTSRSKKRSRSGSRDFQSRSHLKRSRSRSRKRHSKSRSRDRDRKRSSSSRRRQSRSPSGSPYRFGFNKAMDAQERLARRLERAKELTKIKKEEEQKKANGFLGLKDDKLKEAIEKAALMIAGSAPASTNTHELLSTHANAQMDAMRKHAEAETGISVPTYYNPMVVNPLMYAQQQAKRNKLWSKRESQDTVTTPGDSTLWSKASLGDEKSDEKFAKLMGIKQLDTANLMTEAEELKKRQELFSNLDIQYEQARVVTHTQRGAGLGFASGNPNTLLAQQANQQLNPSTSFPPKT